MTSILNDDKSFKADFRRENLLKLIGQIVDQYYRNVCFHETTHRGGFIWTICDDCGQKWADDRGGFKPFKAPSEIEEAEALLAAAKP